MNEDKKKTIIKLVVILGVIIIPLLYSFFYLKAFWDPYGKMDDIPVAIVNLDKGVDGVNAGDELVNTLMDKKVLKLKETSASTAEDGLIHKKYYAVLTIPSDFTKNLNNIPNKNRQITKITYQPNQKTNYLASQIIHTVTLNVEMELRSQINQGIVAQLTDTLNEVPAMVQQVDGGFDTLSNGVQQLNSGMTTLATGSHTLQTNYETFHQGIASLAAGVQTLNESAPVLDDAIQKIHAGSVELETKTQTVADVPTNAAALASNYQMLNTQVGTYVTGSVQAVQTIRDYVDQILTYGTNHPELMADPDFQVLYGTAQAIQNSTEIQSLITNAPAVTGASTLFSTKLEEFSTATTSLNELHPALVQLEQSLAQVQQGTGTLKTGAETLRAGMNQITSGSDLINNGIYRLNSGIVTAADGTKELQTGVTGAKGELGEKASTAEEQISDLDGLSEYAKDPVTIEEKDYSPVKSYGVGFAPYFMSLSLWIGGLLIFMGIYFDSRYQLLGKESKQPIKRSLIYLLIGVAQAIFLGFFLKLGLGYTVTNTFQYYVSCILISVTFLTIIQFLMVNFKDVGKFLTIFLMVLQLAASAGTFPIETVPKGFQLLYPFMPMHYSIGLIKESLVSINKGFAMQNALVLIIIGCIFFGLTVLFDVLKKKKQAKKA